MGWALVWAVGGPGPWTLAQAFSSIIVGSLDIRGL